VYVRFRYRDFVHQNDGHDHTINCSCFTEYHADQVLASDAWCLDGTRENGARRDKNAPAQRCSMIFK
jgi:hypothetical protein